MAYRFIDKIFPRINNLKTTMTPQMLRGHTFVVPLEELIQAYERSPNNYNGEFLADLHGQFRTPKGQRVNHLKGLVRFVAVLESHGIKPVFTFHDAPWLYSPPRSGREGAGESDEQVLSRLIPELKILKSQFKFAETDRKISEYLRPRIAFSARDIHSMQRLLRWLGYPVHLLKDQSFRKWRGALAATTPNASIFTTDFACFVFGAPALSEFSGFAKKELFTIQKERMRQEFGLTDQQLNQIIVLAMKEKQFEVGRASLADLAQIVEENARKPVDYFEILSARYPQVDWEHMRKTLSSCTAAAGCRVETFEPQPVKTTQEFKEKLLEEVQGIEETTKNFSYLSKGVDIILQQRKDAKGFLRDLDASERVFDH